MSLPQKNNKEKEAFRSKVFFNLYHQINTLNELSAKHGEPESTIIFWKEKFLKKADELLFEHKKKVIDSFINWDKSKLIALYPLGLARTCIEQVVKARVVDILKITEFSSYDFNHYKAKGAFRDNYKGLTIVALIDIINFENNKNILPVDIIDDIDEIRLNANALVHEETDSFYSEIQKYHEKLTKIVDEFFKIYGISDWKKEVESQKEAMFHDIAKGIVKEIKKIENTISEVTKEKNIQNFAQLIGISEKSHYAQINQLFVPPIEYEDIMTLLKKEKIVIISGAPESGKTYTAIKLLWEWYIQGYFPVWEKGQSKIARENVRASLINQNDNFAPKTIYYFEDPFGKNKYEDQFDELRGEISKILLNIKSLEDTFLIITTREDIYLEHKKRNLSIVELEPYEKTINYNSPDDKILMAQKHGEFARCYWINKTELKDFVVANIKKDHFILHPLSILRFSKDSVNDNSIELLKLNLTKAKNDSSKQFAQDVLDMNDEEQLFFSIIYLLRDTITDNYLIKKYFFDNNELPSQSFLTIIEKHNNNKIEIFNINNHHWYIRFIHPSFYVAWNHLIQYSKIKNIIDEIIINCQEYGKFWLWVKNYPFLNNRSKMEFWNYASNKLFSKKIADEIIYHYNSIPKETQDLLPEIILLTIHNNGNHWTLFYPIIRNFSKFSLDVQNLVGDYGDDSCSCKIIGSWKKYQDDEVANEVLFKIINNGRAGAHTINMIFKKYNNLPPKIIDSIPTITNKLNACFYDCVFIIESIFTYKKEKEFPINICEIFTKHCYFYNQPSKVYWENYYEYRAIDNLVKSIIIPEEIKLSILSMTLISNWLVSKFLYYSEDKMNFETYLITKPYLSKNQIELIEKMVK